MTGHEDRPAGAPGRLVYSVEEAADLLGIGRTFMFRLLATGEIESFKIGRWRKISRDALDGYVDRLRGEQAAAEDSGRAPPVDLRAGPHGRLPIRAGPRTRPAGKDSPGRSADLSTWSGPVRRQLAREGKP